MASDKRRGGRGALVLTVVLAVTVMVRYPAALRGPIDARAAGVSGCVARDAELDSQWNLVQAAVEELRGCAACRPKQCARVSELVTQAEKGLP